MIVLDKLTVILPGFSVRDVSLHVSRGEFFALMGPTGAGKTVILESIAGLVRVTRGLIRVAGRNVTYMPPEKRRIGIVYQDFALFPHLTTRENICYGLRYFSNEDDQGRQRVDRLVEMLGLQRIIDRRPLHLSGGEKQRVCLARALSVNPSVLLLDEPLSALDPNFRQDIRRALKTLHEELAVTFIIVTHDYEEALYLADRVGIIRDGVMEQVGRTEDVFLKPATPFVAEFVGMKNIFPGQFENHDFEFSGLKCHLPDVVNPGARYLALRPEDIMLLRERRFAQDYISYRGTIEHIVPAGIWHEISVRCHDVRFKVYLDRKTLLERRFHEGEDIYLGFHQDAPHVL